MTDGEMIRVLNRKKTELGSWKAVAKDIGVSQPYLHDVVHGRRSIGPSILKYFGLRAETVYVPIRRLK